MTNIANLKMCSMTTSSIAISCIKSGHTRSPEIRNPVVHNHPSGDPTPSQADIEMTREVAEAAKKLGITLHDHVIIARNAHASFKSLMLL